MRSCIVLKDSVRKSSLMEQNVAAGFVHNNVGPLNCLAFALQVCSSGVGEIPRIDPSYVVRGKTTDRCSIRLDSYLNHTLPMAG